MCRELEQLLCHHGIKRLTVGLSEICFPVQVTKDEIEVKCYGHGIRKQNLIFKRKFGIRISAQIFDESFQTLYLILTDVCNHILQYRSSDSALVWILPNIGALEDKSWTLLYWGISRVEMQMNLRIFDVSNNMGAWTYEHTILCMNL